MILHKFVAWFFSLSRTSNWCIYDDFMRTSKKMKCKQKKTNPFNTFHSRSVVMQNWKVLEMLKIEVKSCAKQFITITCYSIQRKSLKGHFKKSSHISVQDKSMNSCCFYILIKNYSNTRNFKWSLRTKSLDDTINQNSIKHTICRKLTYMINPYFRPINVAHACTHMSRCSWYKSN